MTVTPTDSSYIEWIGFTAGGLTTIAFAPQVVRTWRSGGYGLSWMMLALFGAGVGLWLVYGLLTASMPLILANGLTGLQILMLVGLKVRQALGAGADDERRLDNLTKPRR